MNSLVAIVTFCLTFSQVFISLEIEIHIQDTIQLGEKNITFFTFITEKTTIVTTSTVKMVKITMHSHVRLFTLVDNKEFGAYIMT